VEDEQPTSRGSGQRPHPHVAEERRGCGAGKISFVAATLKGRLVKPSVSPEKTGSRQAARRKATHYVLKVDIGGISGLLAPIVGKQPPDSHVWILGGEAPAFVKAEQPMYLGAPLWRIELASPVWPRTAPAQK
jgi:hypothetical protein